jgi:hypothetical protein
MARFLGNGVYDMDLSRTGDLRALLMHTTPRFLILVEDTGTCCSKAAMRRQGCWASWTAWRRAAGRSV